MMDSCNCELITPKEIINKNICFRIPLYQRPYAWDVMQVRQLLEDFKSAKENNDDKYFIGILSVAVTYDDQNRFDLIDGQQRITTLMLIGRAAMELKFSEDWQQFCTPGRLQLYGRRDDQAFIDKGDSSNCNKRMKDTVEEAKKFFKDNPGMSNFIYFNTAFFLSKVPDSYSLLDKNQQFVRFNNRGQQLEKHEILKTRLISKIKDEDNRHNAFKWWNDMAACLTGLEDNDPKEETASLDAILDNKSLDAKEFEKKESLKTAIVSIPEFLLIALKRWIRNQPGETEVNHYQTDRLLETFDAVFSAEQSIFEFMVHLKKQTDLLKRYFIFVSRDGKYELGTADEKPDESLFTDDNLKKQMIMVQSFLHVARAPHQWLPQALDWLDNNPYKAPSLIQELQKNHEKPALPTIDNMCYEKIQYYWFYRLDYELWKQFEDDAQKIEINPWKSISMDEQLKTLIREFRFRRCNSIEHICPQKPMEVQAEDDSDKFGNLALISASRNSKFSNLPLSGKKEVILQSGYTESLKMVHFIWGSSNIKNLGEQMYNILFDSMNRDRK